MSIQPRKTVKSLGLQLQQLVRVRNPDETERSRNRNPTFLRGMDKTIGKTLSIIHIVDSEIVTLENGYNYHVDWLDVELDNYRVFIEALNVL